MSNLFWLRNVQMARLEPFFPKSHGKPRVDNGRVWNSISSLIAIACAGAMPREYSPPNPLHNLWKRWSGWIRIGVFTHLMTGRAAEAADEETIMIHVIYLKAHRTASSLRLKKRGGRGRLIMCMKDRRNAKLHAAIDLHVRQRWSQQ